MRPRRSHVAGFFFFRPYFFKQERLPCPKPIPKSAPPSAVSLTPTDAASACCSHVRKLRKQHEQELVVDCLLQPIAHSGIASTNVTFLLIRLLTAVARGQVSPKLSNALLRIIDAMRKTMPDTSQEFARTFEPNDLRSTIRALYQEHEDYIGPIEDSSSAPASKPDSPSPQKSPGSRANSGPEMFDFLLKGRPFSSPVTPRDVDTLYHVLERKFAAVDSSAVATPAQKITPAFAALAG